MKKFLFPTLTLIMTVAIAISACAAAPPDTDTTTPPDTDTTTPPDTDTTTQPDTDTTTQPDTSDGNDDKEFAIEDGNLTNNNGLKTSFYLNRSNGKYVNLYVENQGTNSVVATINGQSERTFEPDESGSISVEVTQGWFDRDREYEFKVVAGPNGGRINIYYEIAQQDSQDS